MKKAAPILWSLRKIRSRIPAILVLTLSHIAFSILGVLFALGSSGVIDSAISGDTSAFTKACILQAAIIVGLLITLTINRHLRERLLADLDQDWKRDLLHGLLHGDYATVSSYHSGELLNRLNNDVSTLNSNLLNTIPNLASMITKLVAALSVLISLEPRFSLIMAGAGCVVIVATALMRKTLKSLNKRVSEENGKVSGFLQETLEKLLMVQALDVSEEMERRSDVILARRYKVLRKRRSISMLSNTCVAILAYGASFAALVWCSGGLLRGTITFGTLTAISQLVAQLQSPIITISGTIPQYIAMVAAAERLMELETLCGEEAPVTASSDTVYEAMTGIGAENLSFAYDRDRVFSDASFLLPKGEFGVIVGHSGIGKSTLLKLMLGIYHPEEGQLFVQTPNGRIPLDRSTRGLFAYVPQGNLLISGTLRENLILTCPDATQEQIDKAIHLSAMDDFLPSLPQGLETVLGESAAGLSEGQAQRLSIARAVLSQAPILLLDEATSALDAQTEELVLKRLHAAGKTCIAVTHRPAAIALSQWSMEMKDGKCVLSRL